MGGPGEHHQGNGGVVVDEHTPEVLSLDIKELTDRQGPVEGQLHHVVQPDVKINLNMSYTKSKVKKTRRRKKGLHLFTVV